MGTTLKLNDFQFNSIQGTIFTSATRFVPAKVLTKFFPMVSDQFDASPTVLPLPEEAPPEIPRMILQSSTKQWQAEIAATRVNFRWAQMTPSDTITIEAFRESLLRFIHLLLEMEHARVSRMGLILGRYLIVDNPASVLARYFCRENWLQSALQDPENFELHAHRKTTVGSTFDVNSWIRFKSAQVTLPNIPPRPIVLVEQDVNTLAEEAALREYGIEAISTFFVEAGTEVERRFRNFLEV
jgi:hypothetical protein